MLSGPAVSFFDHFMLMSLYLEVVLQESGIVASACFYLFPRYCRGASRLIGLFICSPGARRGLSLSLYLEVVLQESRTMPTTCFYLFPHYRRNSTPLLTLSICSPTPRHRLPLHPE